jgi:hypothetical protein
MQPDGSILEICHVVRDMERAVAHWTEVLGAGPFYVFDVPPMPGQTNRGVPSAIGLRIGFGFSGGLLIELLQQLDDGPSVFREILQSRGEGFHHVLLRRDFDAGRTHLERHGYALAFSGALPGGERFALFDTTGGNGGFVELMDFTPASFGPVGKIHAAHLAWDGTSRPRRDFAELFSA